MSKSIFGFGLLLLLLVAIHPDAQAQMMGTGRVAGSIKDPEGKTIVGATITADRKDGGAGRTLTATTDDDGLWSMLGFRSFEYEFRFNAPGFMSQLITRGMKQAGKNTFWEIVMEPAPVQIGGGVTTDDTADLIDEATALFDTGDNKSALAKFEKLLEEEPTLYLIHFNIGTIYRAMGEDTKAKESYEKVIAEEPDHAGALSAMGDILIGEGLLDEAVPYFEKALEQSTDAILPFNIAEIYVNNGEATKAVSFYTMAAERDPDWPDPNLKMGYALLNTGNIEQAAAAFEKVIELAPDTPQAQMAQSALDFLK